MKNGQEEYQPEERQREEDIAVDFTRAQTHGALVQQPQGFDPPGGEKPVDAVLAADVVAVGGGENLAFGHGVALAFLLGERRNDGLQSLGKGFARVLHPHVGRSEAAAPGRPLCDGPAAQGAGAEPCQQADDPDEQPRRAAYGREDGREEKIGDGGRGGEEEPGGTADDTHGGRGEETHDKDASAASATSWVRGEPRKTVP